MSHQEGLPPLTLLHRWVADDIQIALVDHLKREAKLFSVLAIKGVNCHWCNQPFIKGDLLYEQPDREPREDPMIHPLCYLEYKRFA